MTEKKTVVLDEYESEILEAYESGKLKPLTPQDDYQAMARNTMKKNRKINIRISENDLSALRRRAAREGIPNYRGQVSRFKPSRCMRYGGCRNLNR